MRQFPDSIDGVVLDSVLPVDPVVGLGQIGRNVDRSLAAFFDACLANDGCGADNPELEERFFDLYTELEANPIDFELPPLLAGEDATGEFDGDALIGTTFSSLYLSLIHISEPTRPY